MTIWSRSFAPEADTEQVIDLLLTGRDAESVYRYPTVRRLRQLLSSRVWEPERDARVWVDDSDSGLVAFAMLWRRRRDQLGSGLEYLHRADGADRSLDVNILGWAKDRTRQITTETGQAHRVVALATGSQATRISFLEQEGFRRDIDGYNPYYALPLDEPETPVQPPDGYTIRPLARGELDDYERLFGFTSMGRDHREELMRSPTYMHLVAVSPDGRLVGYCECSYSPAEWDRSGERVGWIDYVGIDDAYMRRGLGRALMCAGFDRIRSWGAKTAMLVTSSSNSAARALYEGLGMREREQEYAWIWQGC